MSIHLQPAKLRPISSLSACVLLVCLICSLPAAAQFQLGTVAAPVTAVGAGTAGVAGATGAAGLPGAAGPASANSKGTAGPGRGGNSAAKSDMDTRSDQGAADAARLSLQQNSSKPQGTSQFQRFVQESTGLLLPQFGAELFTNPQVYAVDSAAPAPAEYVLGQGDEVRIQIWGATDYAGSHTLDRNGQISLPKIGTLNLSGVQVKDLEATLRKHVATVFSNVTLTASLGKLRGITVYVLGQAQKPGTYNLSSLSTLVNALFASGGPGANGSMRGIQLKRAGKTVTTLDLYDLIAQGDKSKDSALQPGDIIMIPPAGPRVALTGATDHAAIYELKTGTTLQDLLALGGGLPTLVTPQKALLERIDAGQTPPRVVQDLTLNASGLTLPLRDGDVVTLLGISPELGNAVTLQGNVAAPLRYKWQSGMRILDLIPEREALITSDYYKRKNLLVQTTQDSKAAGAKLDDRLRGMVDQINWDYAVIERLNKTQLRTELIPFNLGKAVIQKDPAHNLLLQSGDVVTIMSSTDLQLPADRKSRLVRVEGEVAAPGVYQALPGETLPQLLLRAGGVMPQAYIYGLEFTRESVRKQQQQNLDQVIRRLEDQIQSSSATLAANLTGERAAQTQALQMQQQQQQQNQISRLKTQKSKGRVALELELDMGEPGQSFNQRNARGAVADFAQLPELTLEDGDTILVPSLPMFVSAVGSVSNENVMIYKTGKTVGDIIKAAVPTEDAEVSEAFLLRADGSVFGRRAAGFLRSFESTKVMPGDTVIVPAKIDRETGYNFLVRALRDWSQIFSNLGLGAAAIKTLRN